MRRARTSAKGVGGSRTSMPECSPDSRVGASLDLLSEKSGAADGFADCHHTLSDTTGAPQ